jgi:hypothetical protein
MKSQTVRRQSCGKGFAAVVLAALLLATPVAALADPDITGFPDGDPTSGRFINLTKGLETLGEGGTRLSIIVSGDRTEFLLSIFDGDYAYTVTLPDGTTRNGLWDLRTAGSPEVLYRLYPDKNGDGVADETTPIEQWSSVDMPDSDFYDCTTANSSTNRDPTSSTGVLRYDNAEVTDTDSPYLGDYRYLLSVEWEDESTVADDASNSFKVVVQGQVSGFKETRYGFTGFKWSALSYGGGDPGVYANGKETYIPSEEIPGTGRLLEKPHLTTYEGNWHFHFLIPEGKNVQSISLWNGDFDNIDDSDDDHMEGIPDWATGGAEVGEGVNPGDPDDDWLFPYSYEDEMVLCSYPFQVDAKPRRYKEYDPDTGDPVGYPVGLYHTVGPDDGSWVAEDIDPSGNREWENFRIAKSGDPGGAEKYVSSFPAGHYHWEIHGVDEQNTLFLRAEYELFSEFGSHQLGDRIWFDADNSGDPDDLSEPGINGVKVDLYYRTGTDANGEAIWTYYDSRTTKTVPHPTEDGEDLDGYYMFEFLAAGEYRVVIDTGTLGDYLVPTYDPDGGTANEAVCTLTSNTSCLTMDFSYYLGTGAIGDSVWLDSNADGVYQPVAGELPLAGVKLTLQLDINGDGSTDYTATTSTGASGGYLFNEIPPGTATVRVDTTTLPWAAEQTCDYDDGLGPFDSPDRATYGLGAGKTFLDIDFGYRPKTPLGTGTPGYWKNHPEAWPVPTIEIGGRTWTRDEAIARMKKSNKKDMRWSMFNALVSAKLNVGIGNDFSCVEDEILAADQWMAAYDGPNAPSVAASSKAWKVGEPLFEMLDDYNNGRLPCAEARD